ncbi:MAG: RnfABCDGE type electron transport complex subunit D [Actinobacteria bacterium]|nr:MAG: RnfABCDGE type electron transport complex subunit D [Actinomycetota bacterium]
MVATATDRIATARAAVIRGRRYPVVLPSIRDPRLHLAAVITSLQVLGQTALGFELSIAQILVSLGTCAIIEFTIMFFTRQVLAWPASALLTGNGVAFLLRVNGTEHGQWWSLRGAHIFAATASVSVLSKYLIRWRGRPLFNPSNVGLVLCFLVLGRDRVNPLDFWWGPMSAAMVAVYVIILAGGLIITARVKMVPASLAFWVTFAAGTAVLARRGHCFTARWHVGPVCDASLWRILVTSPEILIFLFFMITDPKTAPLGRGARVLYGALIGFLATVLAATQSTEFGTEVAVLGALVAVCALRPVLELIAPATATDGQRMFHGSAPRWIAVEVVCASSLLFVVPVSRPLTPAARETFVPTDVTQSSSASDIAVPPVVISPAARQLDHPIDDEHARLMGRDLIAALRVQQQLSTKSSAPAYQFDRLTVVVMRASRSSQAVPKLAIRAEGVVSDTGLPADRTYAMLEADGHFLIDGEFDTASVLLD